MHRVNQTHNTATTAHQSAIDQNCFKPSMFRRNSLVLLSINLLPVLCDQENKIIVSAFLEGTARQSTYNQKASPISHCRYMTTPTPVEQVTNYHTLYQSRNK